MGLLLDIAGVGFILTGAFGRLPAAMNQLGLLLVISAAERGLDVAGASVAAVGIGSALSAPLVGRAADRFGPARVLMVSLALQLLGLSGVLFVLKSGGSVWQLLLTAVLVGMGNPQVGSVTRAIWSTLGRSCTNPTDGVRIVRTALGYETAADETSFVVGPVLAGVLVTGFGSTGALIALGIWTAVGEGLFLLWLLRNRGLWAVRVVHEENAPSTSLPIPWKSLVSPLVCIGATGVVFGTVQTTLTALNMAQGVPDLTGPLYGAMGVTSAVAGALVPSIDIPSARKLFLGSCALLLAASALMTGPSPALALCVVLVMGAGAGTVLTTSYSLVERESPRGRVTTVMTVAATCLVLGVSAGAALAGQLASTLVFAPLPAFFSAVVVLVLAVARSRYWTTRQQRNA